MHRCVGMKNFGCGYHPEEESCIADSEHGSSVSFTTDQHDAAANKGSNCDLLE